MQRPDRDRSSGQALLEFALVIPVLLLMLMALFDGGRAVIYYTELSNASRVGARVAMVNQSADASCTSGERTYRCAAAEMATSTGITASSIPTAVYTDSELNPVSPTSDAFLSYGECFVTVSASYTFSPVTPFVTDIFGPIDLNASTKMAIERAYSNP